LAELPFDRLTACPIARIPAVVARRIVLLVTQMMRQLGIQGSLQHSLYEPLQQSVLADDVFRLLIILQELVD